MSTRHLHVIRGTTSCFIGSARWTLSPPNQRLIFRTLDVKLIQSKSGDRHRHVMFTYLHVMLMQWKRAYQYENSCILLGGQKRFLLGIHFLGIARSYYFSKIVPLLGAMSSPKDEKRKDWGQSSSLKHKNCKTGVNSSTETGKCLVKIVVNWLKWVRFWDKMGNPMPVERVMWPNRKNMENYGDLQPCAGVAEGERIGPTIWAEPWVWSLMVRYLYFVLCAPNESNFLASFMISILA